MEGNYMSMMEDVTAIKLDTVNHISSKLSELHISDSNFSRVCGFRSDTFGEMSRMERPLSFSILCAACGYYGFDIVGDRWNPYPDKWRLLPYTQDKLCENVRKNLSSYIDMLHIHHKSFSQFCLNTSLHSSSLSKMLHSSGRFHLDTIIKLALAMKLDRIGYIYMNSANFINDILPRLEVQYYDR